MVFKKLLSLVMLVVLSASCGSYQRTSTEVDVQQKATQKETLHNNKVVTETVETTIDFNVADFLNPNDHVNVPTAFKNNAKTDKQGAKKGRFHQTKTTKITDKGTSEKVNNTDTSLKVDDETKQNPWRPPWYVSGLIVLVLLVVFKVFKTYLKVVRI